MCVKNISHAEEREREADALGAWDLGRKDPDAERAPLRSHDLLRDLGKALGFPTNQIGGEGGQEAG